MSVDKNEHGTCVDTYSFMQKCLLHHRQQSSVMHIGHILAGPTGSFFYVINDLKTESKK